MIRSVAFLASLFWLVTVAQASPEEAFAKAHQTSSAYWGMGKMKKPDGKPTSALVVGKRTYDSAKATVTDNQYYISQTIPTEHYTYVFTADKMTIYSENTSVGKGTVHCDAKAQKCTYDYEVTGTGGYKSHGEDFFGQNPELLYREVSHQDFPAKDKPGKVDIEYFKAEYLPINDQTYTGLKKALGLKD